MYFSAICAGVPRIFTSGPLDSKLRESGLWCAAAAFAVVVRPRPRRFCCPCLTALKAPVLHEPSHIPSHCASAGLLLAAGLGQTERSRELLVHGPSIAATIEGDGLALFSAHGPHAGTASASASHAISASLGRLVVLTIRRLVASNPTCFASLRAPSHSLAKHRWQDAQDNSTELPAYRALCQNPRAFWAYAQPPCSRGNTASLSGDIESYTNLSLRRLPG